MVFKKQLSSLCYIVPPRLNDNSFGIWILKSEVFKLFAFARLCGKFDASCMSHKTRRSR